jgi:GTP-binding protein
VLLLVDAAEGPMPQTRFVLKKSLALGLRPIVVLNKVDRPDATPDATLNAVFDLFVALDARDQQLDFPVVYASGRDGWANRDLHGERKDLGPLLDLVLDHVPPCAFDVDGPAQFQVATLDRNDFLGRIAIGRIYRGRIKKGDRLVCVTQDGKQSAVRLTKIMGFHGMERIDVDEALAGDILALAGAGEVTVGDSLCAEDCIEPLPAIPVDEPTLQMDFMVNNSPFAGREGKYVTSRHVRERLLKELEGNVALRVEETEAPDVLQVSGRGTLSLSILIETMRREGYEMQVGQPRVLVHQGPNGEKLEPYEDVVAECEDTYSGIVVEKLSQRGGELHVMQPLRDGHVHMEFKIPSRGLIGYRSQFLTDTRGTGVLYHVFAEYGPWRGEIRRRQTGALVVLEDTVTTTYAIFNLQDRGAFYVGPGQAVYEGQIIGANAREGDMVVNPGREKKLTNVRAAGADEKLILTPPRKLSLEDALETIEADELVEVTPKAIRMRKRWLKESDRRRFEKTIAISG